jgi:subtilisin family serine protease
LRRFLTLAALAILSAGAAPARAEPIAARLARLFDPARRHPFADATGRIPFTAVIPAGADAAALGLLPVAPGIGAVHLAPGDVASFVAAHPGLHLETSPPRRPLLDVSFTWTRVDAFRQATGLTGKGVIVGVVDTGIDVSHPDFRTQDGHTRIAWALVGGAPAGLHPDVEKAFGCTDPKGTPCAVFDAADIDAMLMSGSTGITDSEGHGTHVTSIAAGNGGPSVTQAPRFVGMAPDATIVVAAPGLSNGGFSDPGILNGARFVMDRATVMKMPAVVNLSLGGDYGPHDGTSALEKGLSALVGDDKPGRAIVVAAGNSGSLYDLGGGAGVGPGGIHTEVSVTPGEIARVPILAAQATKADAFVWITFRRGDDVEVALDGPGGESWIDFVGKGDQAGYAHGSGSDAVQAGVVNNSPAGSSGITSDTNSAAVVFTGAWANNAEFAIRLRGSGLAELWVTGTGDAAAEGSLLFERAIRQGTINTPASAPALLSVGCTINRISWQPLEGAMIDLTTVGADTHPVVDSTCYFSATGPTPAGVQKPEISAPGGFVAAAMAADADPRTHPGGLFDLTCPSDDAFCAVVDDYHAIAAGTSMSAPHVTGAIALLFGLDPTLTQARAIEVLQAGVRNPGGHVPDPNQLGPGEVDMLGAQQAVSDSGSEAGDPDLKRSWYTLSSAYARPDPTWPVWGTVELRRIDGTLAGAIDASKLAIDVKGGAVFQALTRVRQGMWRFAVAGTPADLGSMITVDVTYGGVSLGRRSLPVGNDIWSAMDPSLGATSGGCACGVARAPGGFIAGALAGLFLVGVTVGRRRRRGR